MKLSTMLPSHLDEQNEPSSAAHIEDRQSRWGSLMTELQDDWDEDVPAVKPGGAAGTNTTLLPTDDSDNLELAPGLSAKSRRFGDDSGGKEPMFAPGLSGLSFKYRPQGAAGVGNLSFGQGPSPGFNFGRLSGSNDNQGPSGFRARLLLSGPPNNAIGTGTSNGVSISNYVSSDNTSSSSSDHENGNGSTSGMLGMASSNPASSILQSSRVTGKALTLTDWIASHSADTSTISPEKR